MASSRKFLFDNSFDPPSQPQGTAKAAPAPALEKRQPAPKPEADFIKAELEAARAEGFAAGREQALGEAQAAAEQAAGRALAAIETAVGSLLMRQEEALAAHERSALAAGATIVRKLFPRLAAREAMSEIEQVIEECLQRLRCEPRIVIRVADPLLDQLRERVDSLVHHAGFEGKLVLLADETLAADSVRVEWADGGAERDSGVIWQAIEDVLERALGGAQPNGQSGTPSETVPAAGMNELHHGEPQAQKASAPAKTAAARAPAGGMPGLTQPA